MGLAELPDFLWHNELQLAFQSFAQWSVFRRLKKTWRDRFIGWPGRRPLLGGYEQYFSAYLAALGTQTTAQITQEANAIRTRYPLALLSPEQSLGQVLGGLRHLLARITGKGSDFKFGLAPDLAARLTSRTSSLRRRRRTLILLLVYFGGSRTAPTFLSYYGTATVIPWRIPGSPRLPFCDHRLAEFTLSLPPTL